jgi:defect-in-organelle-trafficking protein DotB
MTDTLSEFPFTFPNGEIYPEIIKKFFVHCWSNAVSDVTIHGGDYIWVERYGRQIKASNMVISHSHLCELVSQLWGADIVTKVVSGEEQDRPLSITGEQYGLGRGESIRLRSNFIQGHVGRAVTIQISSRIIPTELPTLDKYPIEDEFVRELFSADGLNVVAGPTGSGKTTTLTSLYMEIGMKMPDRKVILFEQPVEFILGGPKWIGLKPCQSEIPRDIASYEAGIRNALRRAPKVIGIGEARDMETYLAGIDAAKSGHLLNFTSHINKTGEIFSRVIQAFPIDQQPSIALDLLSILRVVIVQNLFKSTDGKRVMLREGLVFTQDIKNELEDNHYSKWARWVENHLHSKNATIIDKLWMLYQKGIVEKDVFISKATYHEFIKRSGELSDDQ